MASSVSAGPDACLVGADGQLPLWWSLLPKEVQAQRCEEAQKAWDLFWFVNGIPFYKIGSELFRDALERTKSAPGFVPCCRQTLATTRLEARHQDAEDWKKQRLKLSTRFGFLFCTDGWRTKRGLSYHNYILSSVAGPIFLGLVDATSTDGTGQGVHDEVREVFEALPADIVADILIGCTDTPSSNRKAWKLLEETFPRQLWIGCMAHEVALLFKDWGKIPDIRRLQDQCKRITIWFKNHSEMLVLFREKVVKQWPLDKRKHSLSLYMPGDTRMVTTFKLVHRTVELRPVLQAAVTDPEYDRAAQAAIKAYNRNAKEDNRVICSPNGLYRDKVKEAIMGSEFWDSAALFLEASTSAVYLHRLVDSNTPVLGKVYYSCALVAKHLALLAPTHPDVALMKAAFEKRWGRWHRAVHTTAYALDPSYATHELTASELADVKATFKRIAPDTWTDLLVELNTFRSEPNTFEQAEWESTDRFHAYQWWDTFGSVLPKLQPIAVKLLARTSAASACEFNWSTVALHQSQRRQKLLTASTNQEVNVAATYQLQRSLVRRGVDRKLPTLDAAIHDLVNEVEDNTPQRILMSLDEVFDARTEVPEESSSESDDLESEDSDAGLYADWDTRINSSLK